MWIATKPNGTKMMQERITDPMTGKVHVISVKLEKDTAAGRRAARQKLESRMLVKRSSSKHLSDLVKTYMQAQETQIKASTWKRNMCVLNNVVEVLGDPYTDKMTAGFIKQRLLNSGKSVAAMNEYLKRLKACLIWGIQNDMYFDALLPQKLVLFKDKPKRQRIADKYLEAEEIKKLLNAMELPRYRLATEFLLLSGLRIGEFIALDRTDVGESISVTKTYSITTDAITEPKTYTSNREVYVQPELAKVIKQINIEMNKQRLIFGYADNGYFMCGANGARISYAAYRKYLAEKSLEAIGRRITPHYLRHTHCSLLAAKKIPLEVISRRLGHESSEITRNVYFHVTRELQDADNAYLKAVNIL